MHMKFATVKMAGEEAAAIVHDNRIILIKTINEKGHKTWSTKLFDILQKEELEEISLWFNNEGKAKLHTLPAFMAGEIQYGPLYRTPKKILGVGMNYMEKALELSGKPPETEPVIFMKPDTSLIGPQEAIKLIKESKEITAEAELGIIIGKICKEVEEGDAPKVVAGFTTTLDVTAQDINKKNPRFLQRSKSFDTFFSFGPYLITIDEFPNINDIAVATILNEEVHHRNVVANMMYQPWFIVSFFSKIMTLVPGDIIMTGTPGSVVIRNGDIVECNISRFYSLRNKVSD